MANRRVTKFAWLFAFAAFGAGAIFPTLRAIADDDIVVGATVPITGPLAGSGLQYYDALQMARDDINEAGGINGKKLRLLFEDTQASNSTAVNAFIKLAKENNPPFIFLSSYTVQNLAVEPEVANAKIPVVYAGGAVSITDRKNPWMFRLRPPDNIGAEAMAPAISSQLKIKKIGIIHVQDDYGTASAKTAAAAIEKAGLTVVANESYNIRDNDFSPQLLNIKNKGAEALIAISYVRDGALVLSQRRTLGLDIPFFGNPSFILSSLLSLVGPADTHDLYAMPDAFLGETVSAGSADYVKRFAARFNMRADPFGSCYYDAAMIMADALRKFGPDPQKVRDYFANLKDYPGVTRKFTTDERGDMSHSVAFVKFDEGTKEFSFIRHYPQ
jgi:branched-chain amino acid transport system substrate-binding protein